MSTKAGELRKAQQTAWERHVRRRHEQLIHNLEQGYVILWYNCSSPTQNQAEQDTLKEAEAFAKEFKVTYPLLWDETDEVLKTYAVLGLPTSAFVNSEGLIQRIYIGVMSDEQIEDFIGEIIK